jgi:3-oxoacyl-[acyl-carrier protein] reductase
MIKKICLITGCSTGLGLQLMLAFLRKNYKVYGLSSNKKKILKAKKKILNHFSKIDFDIKKVDVSNKKQVNLYIKKIVKKESKIHVLVNNAGIYGPIGPFEKNSYKKWRDAFEINFFGSLNFYKSLIPIMKKQNFGRIVQIAGGGATNSFPMFTSYSSAKAAIVRFSETLSDEVSKYNITINSIAPGALNTKFMDLAIKAGPKLAGSNFHKKMLNLKSKGGDDITKAIDLIIMLSSENNKITGKLISSLWDKWEKFNRFQKKINNSDVYTIRRIAGRDRGLEKFDV